MNSCKTNELYDLNQTIAKPYLEKFIYPWEALAGIENFILELGNSLSEEEYNKASDNVWIHKSAHVYESAYINGPTIICKNAEIRHGAFIRGKAIVGENAVVGNSVELKNVILFNNTEVPHFNYVGDSILGYKAHMGAGSITSNIKSDRTNIVIKGPNIETNLRKIGAMLGDNVEVGCNTVLNPGTVVGKNTTIYPLNSVRGVIPSNSILKDKNNIVIKK